MPSGSSNSRLKRFFHRDGRTKSDESDKDDSGNRRRTALTSVHVAGGGATHTTTTSVDSLQSQPPQSLTASDSVLGATSGLQQLPDPAPLPSPLLAAPIAPSAAVPTADAADTSDTATSPPERLWDRAYDNLKMTDTALIQAYEKILSRKIRDPGLGSSVNEYEPNTIAQDNVRTRREQMRRLIHDGLEMTAQEARAKENVGVAMQVVNSAKDLISFAVTAVPHAALPWTGVCMALEMLANPLAETKANRSGIEYVIKRMNWYWNLSSVLLKENPVDGSGLSGVRHELESQIVDLYGELLSYQIKSVCSYYRNRGKVFLRDIVKLDSWHGKIDTIRKAEGNFRGDYNIYTGQEVASHLEQLVSHATDQVNFQMTEKDEQCVRDLCVTDPRHDKERIENTKGGLLRDSYHWILDNRDFREWRDNEQSRLLWIKGDPGKGKTMLLCGIIDELRKPPSCSGLLSFFFCQATDSRINNATAVLHGLIYLIIEQQPSLISHVRKKYDRSGRQLFEGPNAWFALSGVLADILRDPDLGTTYLIIDALDECVSDLTKLLKLIVENVSASPRVKWIVSSRNWPNIEQQLALADCAGGTKLSLEVNADVVSYAVDSYIAYKVSQLMSIKHNKPLQNQVRELMYQKANDTFLWVALVFKELQDGEDAEYEDDSDILRIIDEVPSDLTRLYSRMLQQVDRLKGRDPKLCRTILSSVSLAYRPLRLLELPIVAGFKGHLAEVSVLERLVNKCGSFLTSRDGIVYFVHQSAQDYLVNNKEAQAAIFPSGLTDVHRAIFSRSLQVINVPGILRRNIYALSCSGTLTDEVTTPEPDPLAPVRYSCVYWIRHLCDGDANSGNAVLQNELGDDGLVALFLKTHLLYWLEALSLLRNIPEGVLAITNLKTLLSQQSPTSQLLNLVEDARRFVLHNRRAVEDSPLQIYSSALIFSPTQSLIRAHFKREEPAWISTRPFIENYWSPCLQTLEGHSDVVHAVAFSGDGTTLASASHDGTVRLWDAATGAHRQTLEGHNDWINAVAFSGDGTTLASASNDKTVRLWDAATGACRQTLEGHDGAVGAVAFSGDGTTLASASGTTVRLWDAATGAHRQKIEGHDGLVSAVAFSGDGMTLASASRTTVLLRDAATGAHRQTLRGHEEWVSAIAFSGDGTKLASASGTTVRLWDAATGAHRQTIEGHDGLVSAVAFSGDGTTLASASNDTTVRLWDAATGACRQTLEGHDDTVSAIVFSGDGTTLASGSYDKTVRLWDAAIGPHRQIIGGHSGIVNAIAFSGDGTTLASASDDKTVGLWDAATGANRQMLQGHDDWVRTVVFSGDSTTLASGSYDKAVRLWDAATGACRQTLEGHEDGIRAIAFSGDGTTLASASYDNTARLWDAATGAHRQTLEGHNSMINAIVFSGDGTTLASASNDTTVRLWDAATGAYRLTLEGHDDRVKAVAFSDDSTMLASASDDTTVRLWDAATGAHRQTLEGHTDWIRAVAFSGDGTTLASASNDKTVRLWDAATGAHRQTLEVASVITQLSFSKDGRHVESNRGKLIINSISSSTRPDRPLQDSCLFIEQEWVIRNGKRLLWLHPDYRGMCMANHGNLFAIGYGSGRVRILQFGFPDSLERARISEFV